MLDTCSVRSIKLCNNVSMFISGIIILQSSMIYRFENKVRVRLEILFFFFFFTFIKQRVNKSGLWSIIIII